MLKEKGLEHLKFRFEPGKMHGASMDSLKKMRQFVVDIMKSNFEKGIQNKTNCSTQASLTDQRKKLKTSQLNTAMGLEEES
jgi:hypothetical protein